MRNHTSNQWRVEVVTDGRSGSVAYYEGSGCISFYWELGGGETVVIISVDDESTWSKQHPWAVGRRQEILERVAHEVVRQKAPSCRAEIDDAHGYIYIREHTG